MRNCSLLAVALVSLAGPVIGATTYNFLTTAPSGNTNVGSSRSITQGGITVTMTAWTVNQTSGSTLQAGRLLQWNGYGMGVCSNADNPDPDCGIPSHSIDNETTYDFVLFQFSTPVRLTSFVIDPYAPGEPGNPPSNPNVMISGYNFDRDVTYYTRSLAGTPALSGATLASLTSSLGFAATNQDSTGSYNALTVNLGNVYVTSFLFGSRVGGDPNLDYFKLNQLTIETTPEPGTLGLMGGALLALGFFRHRSRRRKGAGEPGPSQDLSVTH